jgi:hypothetical protein
MLNVSVEHLVEVAAAGDEEPVGAFAAERGNPSLGDRVHPRRLWRREHYANADRGEHRVEGRSELGVPLADQVGEPVSGLFKICGEIARQLGCPSSGRVMDDAEQVDSAGTVLDHESRVQTLQGQGVDVEEVDRE